MVTRRDVTASGMGDAVNEGDPANMDQAPMRIRSRVSDQQRGLLSGFYVLAAARKGTGQNTRETKAERPECQVPRSPQGGVRSRGELRAARSGSSHFWLNVDSDCKEQLVTVVSHFPGVSIPESVTGVVAGVGRESSGTRRKGRDP